MLVLSIQLHVRKQIICIKHTTFFLWTICKISGTKQMIVLEKTDCAKSNILDCSRKHAWIVWSYYRCDGYGCLLASCMFVAALITKSYSSQSFTMLHVTCLALRCLRDIQQLDALDHDPDMHISIRSKILSHTREETNHSKMDLSILDIFTRQQFQLK